MTIAIDFAHQPALPANGEVIGINVAVDGFLSAWFRYGQTDKFICHPSDAQSYAHFIELAQQAGMDTQRCIGLNPTTPAQNLSSLSCLFRPDPGIGRLTWLRQQIAGKGFVACGLVHTMSGSESTAAAIDLCLAPTENTDALICPSRAIRDVVHNIWNTYSEYLAHRFGARFQCPVQTPVAPLGIDTDKFAALATGDKRKTQREALGLGDNDIAILFVGRLSFATKAHPLPLMMAAELAAQKTKKKLHLIFYGYFKPEDMEPQFKALAKDICKTVSCIFIENTDARFPHGLWAGADIFASLTENVQESFGLTPIEAMACGLPCVVTDWDGYREGVRHGMDGFLIPTIMPPALAGMDMARNFFNDKNYGTYLVGAAQSTAVDISKAADAFVTLADDDTKRHQMGSNAREHAKTTYDWRVVIQTYQLIWHQLGEMRQTQPMVPAVPEKWNAAHPLYQNPYAVFDSFPTQRMAQEDYLTTLLGPDDIKTLLAHPMNYFVHELLLPADSLIKIADIIRQNGRVRIGDILCAKPVSEHPVLWRCIGWLVKHGVCAYEKGT